MTNKNQARMLVNGTFGSLRATSALLAALPLVFCIGCDEKISSVPVAQLVTADAPDELPEGYWPRWSGPNGDLISTERGWSAEWPESGPTLLWRGSVGTGFSSVSVAKNKLYTMGNRDGQDIVFCLDATTGKEIWQHSYPCALVDNLHEGGPGATPTIDGDRVYTLSREGHLFCLGADDGKVLWSKMTPDETGVRHPEWGFTCSPRVLGDSLILEVGRVIAFDKESGDVKWKTEDRYRPGYGSPEFINYQDTPYVAVFTNDCLLVVRASDGKKIATHDWETSYATTSATPIAIDDTIFVSSGYGRGCALLRFNGQSLGEIYDNKNMRNHFNNSVLLDGYLYGIDGNSHNAGSCRLVCMNVKSGERVWGQRGMGCGSLMAADGKLIVLSDDGVLSIVAATPSEYKEISKARVLEGRCWTVPVLAGHRIYARNATGDLVCVDVSGKGTSD